MSERYEFSEVGKVESVCTDLLIRNGITSRKDASEAVLFMLAAPEVEYQSPDFERLVEIYRDRIPERLREVENEYEAFPTDAPLETIEEQLLGVVGLGLEGEIPGPLSAHRWITHAGRADPPAWAADDLPATSLPIVQGRPLLHKTESGEQTQGPAACFESVPDSGALASKSAQEPTGDVDPEETPVQKTRDLLEFLAGDYGEDTVAAAATEVASVTATEGATDNPAIESIANWRDDREISNTVIEKAKRDLFDR